MAILSGHQILKEREAGNIVIDPFDPDRLNPNSYNLRLADKLLVYRLQANVRIYGRPAPEPWARLGREFEPDDHAVGELDMTKKVDTVELAIPPGGLVLRPGVLYLGSTMEYTETHGLVPCIEGRSSVGRLGIIIHQTAGFGDCGFKGRWTLEITVVHPVRVYAGAEVCQIVYQRLEGKPEAYRGKYQNQPGAVASELWRDFKTEPKS